MKGRLSRSSMILKEAEAPAEIQAQSLQAYAGQEGVTSTPLRPAGQIELGGQRLNAASGGDFLPKGTKVVVTGAEGDHVLVRPL
jgi:membrane-bound serine protease (ClpP class)